ncbi:unnamed protein product, partial [Ectocarpus sp. 8 AP-2014]
LQQQAKLYNISKQSCSWLFVYARRNFLKKILGRLKADDAVAARNAGVPTMFGTTAAVLWHAWEVRSWGCNPVQIFPAAKIQPPEQFTRSGDQYHTELSRASKAWSCRYS